MLKKIILFFAICFLGANEPSVFDMMDRDDKDKFINMPNTTKAQTKQNINLNDLKNILPTDEPDIMTPNSSLYDTPTASKNANLKVLSMPKSALIGEIFKVEVLLSTFSDIDFTFLTKIDQTNVKWLNKNLTWVKNGETYATTIFLQAKNQNAKSTKLEVSILRNGDEFNKTNLIMFLPRLKELKAPNFYNNIVADLLEVKKFKTTKFDDENYIMIVELNAKNADLGSFYLHDKTIIKQGVDTIVGDFGSQSAYYFAVFKPNKRTLEFNYYNQIKQKFETFSLPVSVEDDEISTHVGLNPKQSEVTIYKNITVYSLAGLLFVLGIFRRRVSYFIAVALLLAYGIYSYNPFRKATLKPEVNVRILPIKNSTIFYVSSQNESVEILDNKDEYFKILFNDGKIGWVKKDEIVKN